MLLGPEGLAAQAMEDYECRPEQLAMARKVQEAMRGRRLLASEAGTGVGKSFAYLAGAIDQAIRKGGKVLISTYTLSLQQQLMEKDIPFLQEIVPHEFVAAAAKGRNNYVCLRRLEYARKRQRSLFEDGGAELDRIMQWARQSPDGCVSGLGILPSWQVWQAVQSEHGVCRGRKCPTFRECFYWRNRRKLDAADLIVANHALLLSDLVLKEAGAGVMPEYKFVICDEAHTLEHVAEDHFGISISQSSVAAMLNGLYHPRKRKGLLAFADGAETAQHLTEDCREAMQVFFAQVQAWQRHAGEANGGACQRDFVEDNLSEPLKALRLELTRLCKAGGEEEDEQFELQRMADRCRAIETDLKLFLSQEDDQCVYWVEDASSHRRNVVLRSAPLHVGPYVRRVLFEPYESVILTSATLSCGQGDEKEGFAFFAGRLGLEDYDAFQTGSPFDYARQVQMHIETDLPEPKEPDFVPQAAEVIERYLLQTEGRAFVLFTSYAMLRQMAERMRLRMEQERMELLVQGERMDRASLLEYFKTHPRCVLFGTDSFWQGVDVPGEQLSNVIIVRLPFAVPNHPLIRGRIEQLRREGRNPFYEYQLPMAILKFKQGFGRLIRRKTDTGIVVVLDNRIVQKAYGRLFIDAVPRCRTFIGGAEQEQPTY